MKIQNNEEATAPIIGVILMVAVTVILAAVIGMYVFGMPEDIDNTNMVAISVKQIDDQLQVTYLGSSAPDEVIMVNATSYNGAVINDTGSISYPDQGEQFMLNGGTNDRDRVVVVASFANGNSQVVYDEMI